MEAFNRRNGTFLIMDIFIVIALIFLINTYLVKALNNKYNINPESYLWILFVVHFALTATYILYAFANRSDSFAYYDRATRTEDWLGLLIYGTSFIDFMAWPFVKLLSLSYISVMLIFSYFGYIALLLFYLSVNENVNLKPVWNNMSAKELIFLLPNVHFWSSSLGKGSVILLGLGFFIFGLSRFNRRGRGFLIFLGSLLTLMIRPHIFLTLVTSVMIGILITSSGIKPYVKWLIFSVAVILFIYISQDVLKFANVESLDVFSSDKISNRAQELSKSKSGVDISNYNLAMKMFTFWFRPLFIDASGVMGLIVSIENLLYLYFFVVTIKSAVQNWMDWNGWFRISIFVFILGSFILAQVTGNLGIAIRQKAQFMPFFFIIYCKALYYQQYSFKRKQQINTV
jgi:hypothetical protein